MKISLCPSQNPFFEISHEQCINEWLFQNGGNKANCTFFYLNNVTWGEPPLRQYKVLIKLAVLYKYHPKI